MNRDPNQAAYEKLRDYIARTYPPGRFVALAGGKIVADADTLKELCADLRKAGVDPNQAMAVQAGVEYPEEVTILGTGFTP
jgi:cysteine synthase